MVGAIRTPHDAWRKSDIPTVATGHQCCGSRDVTGTTGDLDAQGHLYSSGQTAFTTPSTIVPIDLADYPDRHRRVSTSCWSRLDSYFRVSRVTFFHRLGVGITPEQRMLSGIVNTMTDIWVVRHRPSLRLADLVRRWYRAPASSRPLSRSVGTCGQWAENLGGSVSLWFASGGGVAR